jgi:hypothetical protein
MAAAARGTSARQAPPDIELTARRAAPEVRAEAKHPLPYPDPVGINDNQYEDAPDTGYRHPSRPARRRPGVFQLAARILIAPLYVAVAIGTVGVIVLFVRGFLG